MRLFAILRDNGTYVYSPDWFCPADVIMAGHGGGAHVEGGTLMYRENDDEEWQPWTGEVSA